MRLTIVRHGQTLENRAGISQGHRPGTLSELGIEQARLVAERLKDAGFNYIYTSDLARARDTADVIRQYHDCPFIVTEDLRERCLGSHEGVRKVDQTFPAVGKEPREEILARAQSILNRARDDGGNNVLFVAHNGFKQYLLIHALGRKQFNEYFSQSFGNTAVTILDPYPTVSLWGCTDHLD